MIFACLVSQWFASCVSCWNILCMWMFAWLFSVGKISGRQNISMPFLCEWECVFAAGNPITPARIHAYKSDSFINTRAHSHFMTQLVASNKRKNNSGIYMMVRKIAVELVSQVMAMGDMESLACNCRKPEPRMSCSFQAPSRCLLFCGFQRLHVSGSLCQPFTK